MKIRFKNKELSKGEYRVVAKSADLSGGYTYIYFNENLQEMRVRDCDMEITDHDTSDMVQRNDLNYGKEFYINEFITQLIPLHPGCILSTGHIWLASKLFRYFEKYNYEIPDSYRSKVLNENHKMSLIEGFLMAINPYMERKFIGGHYFEYFEFYKGKAISEIELKINDSLEELNVTEYKTLLKAFIEKSLNDTYDNEEISKNYAGALFSLVDSLFIYEITRIFSYKTFYDDCFVIEHQNEYYYLNQYWWG